jgi:hypothetical protein
MLGKARWLKERTGRSGTRRSPGPRQATRACRPLAPGPAAVIGGCHDASTKNDGGTRNHGFSRSRPWTTNAHADTSGRPPNSASGSSPNNVADTSGPSANAAATSRDAAAATQGITGAGRKVAGTGMAVDGSGFPVDGGGSCSSALL